MHLLAMYLLFLPLFSSVDPVTVLMPLWSTTSPTTPPSRLNNQASPAFDHPNVAHSILSLDNETDAAAGAPTDYAVDDPSFLREQPGKPPLDHQISPILLYTACIRVV